MQCVNSLNTVGTQWTIDNGLYMIKVVGVMCGSA